MVRLVNPEQVRVRSSITAALSKNEGMVSQAISNGCDGFLVEASSTGSNPSTGCSNRPISCLFYDLFFCLALVNVFDIPFDSLLLARLSFCVILFL